MPTWVKSFKAATAVVVFGLLWALIGLVVLVGGLYLMGLPVLGGIGLAPATPGIGGFVLGAVVTVVGLAIMLLGFLASFLKVTVESVVDEVKSLRM
ncbi:MAG: hypothetical protein E6K18_03945 [Methanobacteriota archaeon]|nr:MAG: hypothetical protein E6K18_03945 [Euryarchaeota archaeon]